MSAIKAIAARGVTRVLHVVRLVVVAVVCLLIGVSARQLFDAYGKERIPFLREKDMEAEVHVFTSPQQETSLTPAPVEHHWN